MKLTIRKDENMTLQEKFTQKHVATIQLNESAQIGEFGSSEETRVTPGTYNVYKVTKKDEGYYGLMYAQEGDFYTNIETMDMVDIRGVDAATYGIASNQGEYDTCSVDVYVRDNGGCSPTAYVTQTNSGDGAFAVFTNSDNTAFFLDDENIYLNYLIEERHPEDAADIIGVFDGFEYEPEKKEITAYFHRLDISERTITVGEGKRNIDTIAEVYVAAYETEKLKQQDAEDKLTPKETEMHGFTQINLRDESDAYNQGFDDMWNHDDVTSSYVAPTNDGDSDYVVYSNKDRTAFLLDDENIYLKYLLQYKDVEAYDAYKGLYGFDINFNKRRIDMVYDGEQSYITPNDGERIVDALAEAIATQYEARYLEEIENYGMVL